MQWASQNVGYIINCSNVSYAWHPWCVRFWLNPQYWSTFEGVSWEDRMSTTMKLVLAALMFGEGVLLHCRQGKHRSGALCVLTLALLRGTGIDGALDLYFAKRSDLRSRDCYIVRKILDRTNYPQLLAKLEQQVWC